MGPAGGQVVVWLAHRVKRCGGSMRGVVQNQAQLSSMRVARFEVKTCNSKRLQFCARLSRHER